MENASPWFRVIALMVVGSVAKSLFGTPPRYSYSTNTQATEPARNLAVVEDPAED